MSTNNNTAAFNQAAKQLEIAAELAVFSAKAAVKGVKGWLRENASEITYVTAMAYRKLAEVTCKAIRLPEFIPLEWVLPGTEEMDETRELNPDNKLSIKLKRRALMRQIKQCRDDLTKLLDGASNMNQLFEKLDGITHEHRHRAHVRITVHSPKYSPEQKVGGLLQSALQTVQSMNPNDSLENIQSLIGLLSELRKQFEVHSA